MLKCGNLNRRDFIRGTAVTVAVTTAGCASVGPGADASESGSGGCLAPLIASAPILQNAAETSIGVAFAVSADASGWVEYSTSADMMGAKRVYSGGHGLMRVDNKVALIRLTGLRPATRYFFYGNNCQWPIAKRFCSPLSSFSPSLPFCLSGSDQ